MEWSSIHPPLTCGHKYCISCLLEWIEDRKKELDPLQYVPCPLCRKILTSTELYICGALNHFITENVQFRDK